MAEIVFKNKNYILYDDDSIVLIETGEMFSKDEFLDPFKVAYELVDTYNDYCKRLKVDRRLEYKRNKVYSGVVYNPVKRYYFTKTITTKADYFEEILENSEYAGFFYMLARHVDFPKNAVVINKQYPTNKELQDKYKIGEKKLAKIFGELIRVGAIKRIYTGERPQTYINPYIYNRGNTDIATIKMFKDTVFATKHDRNF